MLELALDSRLADEPLEELGARVVAAPLDELERDVPPDDAIATEPHLAHPARTEHLLERVSRSGRGDQAGIGGVPVRDQRAFCRIGRLAWHATKGSVDAGAEIDFRRFSPESARGGAS